MPKSASACAIKWVTALLFGTTACIPAERAIWYSWGKSWDVNSTFPPSARRAGIKTLHGPHYAGFEEILLVCVSLGALAE
jgi:hypothetical protein